ncbi:MAG TPA: efflux RND transporter periplasmic adaptor subunit [Thermoanaerobaculia bacterium]|nr:efflux RND transporter periplasmic adaptor subunit [Thermoanaerobaculia bacterium]
MSKKKKIILGVVGVVVVLLVVMGLRGRKDKDVARVTTAKVEKIDLVSKVTANGKIQARRKVDLSALVMGQIVNLAVKEGDVVDRGQLLLQIDRAQLAAQTAGRESALGAMRSDLAAARATAEQARRDFQRAKQNWDAKILSEAEYQKARSVLDTAEANLSAAQQRLQETGANLTASRDSLSKTTVTAPLAGMVTFLPVKEGEVTVIGTMNNPGTQLLTISDMSEVEAVMMVDETSVPEVKVGQKASLSVDAYPNRNFEGVVTEVGSSPISKNDPDLLSLTQGSEAINFKVKIRVVNPPETIRPGFSVTADILTGRTEGATAIPIQALVVRDVPKKNGKDGKPAAASASTRPQTEEGVYLIKAGKLAFEKVETGLAGELMIEVKKGPAVGAEIVTGPFKVLRQVKEGDKVIVEKEGEGKGKPKGGQAA